MDEEEEEGFLKAFKVCHFLEYKIARSVNLSNLNHTFCFTLMS